MPPLPPPAASAPLVPFSACHVWRQQRSFFETEGVNAWNGQVPFYITSNPYLAHAYATLILRFLQDCQAAAPSTGPFYVLELGAGSGTFAFHLLRRLAALREAGPFLPQGLCYVMSDLSAKNLEFWRQHAALAPFVAAGQLDFAQWDAEARGPLALEVSGRVLAAPQEGAPAPLVVVANYALDALSCDVFTVEEGQLGEVVVDPALALPPNEAINTFCNLLSLLAGARVREVPAGRFGSPLLAALLAERAAGAAPGAFLFPTGALACLEHLAALAGGRMLLLFADKGLPAMAQLDEESRLAAGLHGGSVSTLVDLDLAAAAARRLGGAAYLHQSEGIVTGALSFGADFVALRETGLALSQFMGSFNPGRLYDVLSYFEETKPRARLETLLGLFELTQWDPYVFDQFFDVLMASLPYADGRAVDRLVEQLPQIAAAVYVVPGGVDTYFNLASFLHRLSRFAAAKELYEASMAAFGETDTALFNLGLCLHGMGDDDAAIQAFERCLELTPDYIKARGWIAQIAHERGAG